MAHRWYVVHAYSGFENKVAQSIREQVEKKGLTDEISQVMVPTEEVVEVRRGAKVQSERKFFPGYVLVKMDLNDETWHLIKNTAKVTGFLAMAAFFKLVFEGRLAPPRFTMRTYIEWQEWRDSNPRPSVLETDALPAELHSFGPRQ